MAIAQNFPTIKPALNLDFANVKALDPRVTFSRASSATYYGTQTAKAEENLLILSQEMQLTATWLGFRVSRTADATNAPDGTSTADSIVQASGETNAGFIYQNGNVRTDDFVVSIFAKANGKNFLSIGENYIDTSINQTWFDIVNGTVGTTDAGHTASIVDVGDGWFRCIVKFTPNAARSGNVRFYLADTDGSNTVADDGNGLYLWGAQLEQRSAVTAYTPTTDQPITNYIPVLQTASANVARFDHNPVTGESLGLLVEEQRTNLVLYSQEFDNADWTKLASTVTANSVVSPDGTLNADTYVVNSGVTINGNPNFQNIRSSAVSVTTATTYTYSAYIKTAGYSVVRLVVSPQTNLAGTAVADVTFNVSTGVITTTATGSGTITPVGNGWYRCTITGTTAGTTVYCGQLITDTGTANGYSGIYIWGAMLEQGGFSTSYVKTEASQVTRSADSASMTGTNFSSWYRQDEGTLYGDALFGDLTSGRLIASITGSINSERLTIGLASAYSAASVIGNVVQANLAFGTKISNPKIAFAYKVNDFAASGNGSSVATDTSGNLPVVDRLFIGSRVDLNPVVIANGHIRKLSFYPQRLTNEQLQALTS